MDLADSVQKHAEWKTKFRAAIAKQEQMDAATIAKDNCCPVGMWLHGDGKSICNGKPEYLRAVDAHKQFHVEAGKVARLINAKQYADAEKAIGNDTPYSEVSRTVGVALMALKKVTKS